jgi:hypothetical protein
LAAIKFALPYRSSDFHRRLAADTFKNRIRSLARNLLLPGVVFLVLRNAIDSDATALYQVSPTQLGSVL